MERPICFMDYDKVTDDVLYLGSKLILRLNVSLSRKNENNERSSFHKEYKYASKYSTTKLITLRRSFDYFLTLDKTDTRDNVMIRVQDMIILRRTVEKVVKWFDGNNEIFAMKRNKLMVYKRPEPEYVRGLADNKWLRFEPIVITWENTGDQCPGVRITLGDDSIYCDISIDKMYSLVYILQTFNMYQSAQELLNYLGRPEYGTNLTEFESDFSLIEKPEYRDSLGSAKDNRRIATENQNKSYFEKLDNL